MNIVPSKELSLRSDLLVSEEDPGGALADCVLLNVRGGYVQVDLSAGEPSTPGIYNVRELSDDLDGEGFVVLIRAVDLQQSDIISQMAGLNNFKVVYTFGQAFGQTSIFCELLLGRNSELKKEAVTFLENFFNTYRVSVFQRPISVSVADQAKFVYLTGLSVGRVEEEFNVLPFILTGTVLDLAGRNSSALINPDGEVLTAASVDEPSLFDALNVRTAPEVTAVSETPVVNEIVEDPQTEALPEEDEPAAETYDLGTLNTPQAVIDYKQERNIPLTAAEIRYLEYEATLIVLSDKRKQTLKSLEQYKTGNPQYEDQVDYANKIYNADTAYYAGYQRKVASQVMKDAARDLKPVTEAKKANDLSLLSVNQQAVVVKDYYPSEDAYSVNEVNRVDAKYSERIETINARNLKLTIR